MVTFNILKEIPITACCQEKYSGMAYDGCSFYISVSCKCEILEYSRCLEFVRCIPTCRAYTCICYDAVHDCFWAAGKKNYELYKLDNCFCEIDCIHICPCKNCGAEIMGVACDCHDGTVLVAFTHGVARIDTACGGAVEYSREKNGRLNTGIMSLSPFSLQMGTSCREQTIRLCSEDSKIIKECSPPCGFTIKNICFCPCISENGCVQYRIVLLADKKNCYFYFLEYCINPMDFDLDIYPCNFDLMAKCCCHGSHSNPCDDIVESIALIETALAHILNAEGEKIQKIISCTDDADEILRVNKAVNQTIVNISHLETILYDKLVVAGEGCKPKECSCLPCPVIPCCKCRQL